MVPFLDQAWKRQPCHHGDNGDRLTGKALRQPCWTGKTTEINDPFPTSLNIEAHKDFPLKKIALCSFSPYIVIPLSNHFHGKTSRGISKTSLELVPRLKGTTAPRGNAPLADSPIMKTSGWKPIWTHQAPSATARSQHALLQRALRVTAGSTPRRDEGSGSRARLHTPSGAQTGVHALLPWPAKSNNSHLTLPYKCPSPIQSLHCTGRITLFTRTYWIS